MSISQCMKEHTHREYLEWQLYLEEQWNAPTRTDYYLMQISRDIARVLAKQPRRINTDDFLINFQPKQETHKTVVEETKEQTKQRWFSFVGLK